jgi:FAD:protein FMN transferase
MAEAMALSVPRLGRAGIWRTESVMGTVFRIDVRDEIDPAAVASAFELLHDLDATFSTYREDSEIRQLDRGEVALDECSPDVRFVLDRCEDLRRETDGAFDAGIAGRDARLDPSGFVKGWAADRAAAILEAAGARTYSVNAGGDVIARGEPESGRGWRIGVRHPGDRAAVAAVLEVRHGAVATSGTYERGGHITHPRTGVPAAGLRSMTVIGPDLSLADAYATAAFVMGEGGAAWVARRPGFGAIAIRADDQVVWTPLAEELRVTE